MKWENTVSKKVIEQQDNADLELVATASRSFRHNKKCNNCGCFISKIGYCTTCDVHYCTDCGQPTTRPDKAGQCPTCHDVGYADYIHDCGLKKC